MPDVVPEPLRFTAPSGGSVEVATPVVLAPMAGITNTKSVMVAKWVGPCKSDQKPGDVIVNGQKMNLLSMGQPQQAPQKK